MKWGTFVQCMVRLSLEQPEVGARWCGELSLHLLCAQIKHLIPAPCLPHFFTLNTDLLRETICCIIAVQLCAAVCMRSRWAGSSTDHSCVCCLRRVCRTGFGADSQKRLAIKSESKERAVVTPLLQQSADTSVLEKIVWIELLCRVDWHRLDHRCIQGRLSFTNLD